jgi:formate dehydrogenase subunit gamma
MIRKEILRYTANQRTNHWLVAILFFMAGLSGLALFHPALFWLSNLFGGGPWTRILHPFMGVLMFVLFLGWWCVSGAPTSSSPMTACGCAH